MSLFEIRAKFNCDACCASFSVDIDAAYEPSANLPSMFDVAVDAVRGSVDYRGKTAGCSSVQDGKHLCAVCTATADGKNS